MCLLPCQQLEITMVRYTIKIEPYFILFLGGSAMFHDAIKYLRTQLWFWMVMLLVITLVALSAMGLVPWYAIFEALGAWPLVAIGVLVIIPFFWGVGKAFHWSCQEENPRLIVFALVAAVTGVFAATGHFKLLEWWVVWLILAVLAVLAITIIGGVSLWQEVSQRKQPRSHAAVKTKKPSA